MSNDTRLVRCVAVIPARGGSKGIPRKNLARVGDATLVARAIACAIEAKRVDRVIVSTDDDEIAEAALSCGAEVPFRRPAELSSDSASTPDVVVHALRSTLRAADAPPDTVVCLQPTSPLRSPVDVDEALRLLAAPDVDAVVSVTKAWQHPLWMKVVSADGSIREYEQSADLPPRRQLLPAVYALNGAVYAARLPGFLARGTWYGGRTVAYIMPPDRSIDVDSPWDLRLANCIVRMGS